MINEIFFHSWLQPRMKKTWLEALEQPMGGLDHIQMEFKNPACFLFFFFSKPGWLSDNFFLIIISLYFIPS